MAMDINKIRQDFPALMEKPELKPFIYFDNTSVTLTPKPVVDSMVEYYSTPGNLKSGHEFSVETMIKCNDARTKICKFLNANSPNEIIWTKNATEGLNLISKTFDFRAGDTILTTDKEHNSNLAPWHNLRNSGVNHKIVRSNQYGTFDLDLFERSLTDNVKLVSMCLTSIIDGYTLPAEDIIRLSHEHGALVLLDAVLTAPQKKIDVKKLDVDFIVISISNMCGPNGLGVLYGKEEFLNELKPFLGGGGANTNITYYDSQYQTPPAKFEAGSMNCASIIGASTAIDYLNKIGFDNIEQHALGLNESLTNELTSFENISILGPVEPRLRGNILNFNVKDFNPHDIAITLEETCRILVRSGHLCAHSWFNEHRKDGAISISFYIYNTKNEIEILAETLNSVLA